MKKSRFSGKNDGSLRYDIPVFRKNTSVYTSNGNYNEPVETDIPIDMGYLDLLAMSDTEAQEKMHVSLEKVLWIKFSILRKRADILKPGRYNNKIYPFGENFLELETKRIAMKLVF